MTTLTTSIGLACLLLAAPRPGAEDPPPPPPSRKALLVGCTTYQLPTIRELWGPANDAPMWAKLLTEDFGFHDGEITRFVGWPDEASARPTRANIVGAFERLAASAGEGDQIVIVLSGHGAQAPVPEGRDDPDNPEPDGLDELFLPADVKAWTPEGVEGGIKDDEIGRWLRDMRSKGAHVWIIFDCCHSGTMTRGGGDNSAERSRTSRPGDLKIPEAAIAAATARAKRDAPGTARPTDSGAASGPRDPKAKGSLVAFYAAQPFEESPELPKPDDAAQVRGNYYGLFSYTLTTALSQRKSPLSYRELAHLVATRYRADRRARPPTAFAEGDLDREVLGMNVWPDRGSMVLSRSDRDPTTLVVNAGGLAGLAKDSVLEVRPPAGDTRGADAVIGHVKVVSITPFAAVVEPVTIGEEPANVSPPDSARCRVLERSLGDMRVTLAIVAKDDPGRSVVRSALAAMPESVRALAVESADPAKAEWWLQVEDDFVHLRQGPGRSPSKDEPAGEAAKSFERYPRGVADRLSGGLTRDLQKIFKWQNVWRIAGAMSQNEGTASAPGLRLEVRLAPGPIGPTTAPLVSAPTLRPGQWIEVQLFNDGKDNLWVTMLNLDGQFGIQRVPEVVSLQAGRSSRPERSELGDDGYGSEGLVVFGTPIDATKEAPDFKFLEQEPLGNPQVIERQRGEMASTPFGLLMDAAAFGSRTRGKLRSPVQSEPRVVSATWVTIPADR